MIPAVRSRNRRRHSRIRCARSRIKSAPWKIRRGQPKIKGAHSKTRSGPRKIKSGPPKTRCERLKTRYEQPRIKSAPRKISCVPPRTSSRTEEHCHGLHEIFLACFVIPCGKSLAAWKEFFFADFFALLASWRLMRDSTFTAKTRRAQRKRSED